jgi:hypothetical protein
VGPSASLNIWRRENLLSLPRTEQRLLGHPAYSLVIEQAGIFGFYSMYRVLNKTPGNIIYRAVSYVLLCNNRSVSV